MPDLNKRLQIAAGCGNLELVNQVISDGVNIHVQGDIAFRIAAANGHLPVVNRLAELGAIIHACEVWLLYLQRPMGTPLWSQN